MTIVADFFYINKEPFSFTNVEKTYAKFCVKKDHTVNFEMFYLTWSCHGHINLKRNSVVVYHAVYVDTKYLFWREKVTQDSTFELTFRAT